MKSTYTCSDCGLSPIPPLEEVYVGSVIMCHSCAYQAPKTLTMYCHAGQLWHNDTAGGKPINYVRGDLLFEVLNAFESYDRQLDTCDAASIHGLRSAVEKARKACGQVK